MHPRKSVTCRSNYRPLSNPDSSDPIFNRPVAKCGLCPWAKRPFVFTAHSPRNANARNRRNDPRREEAKPANAGRGARHGRTSPVSRIDLPNANPRHCSGNRMGPVRDGTGVARPPRRANHPSKCRLADRASAARQYNKKL